MDKPKIDSLFRYQHLPEALQEVSKPFHELALAMIHDIPQSSELTLAIRKLWEVKNLAVFAKVESMKEV